MAACPACRSRMLRRSHYRTWERVAKYITRLRPYRCEACGWRGWRRPEPLEEYAWHGNGATVTAPEPAADVDLASLDTDDENKPD
jgi:hypothetical protein